MDESSDTYRSTQKGSVSSLYASRPSFLAAERSLEETSKEVENVRITPAKIVFRDAYDGKKFNQSFKIMNIGKYPVLVRVFAPTSKAFQMKPLPRGRYLASGMSVSRKITYTYSSAMAISQARLSIYVNETLILYEIRVFISTAFITLTPKILNFGEIDVGTASEQMSVLMTNMGRKGTQFAVDLSRNTLELIVHPMKGVILPLKTQEIKVEILGSVEGTFLKEFWIKTEPPQRVWITGTFIPPKLILQRPITTSPITVIDFPKTYYGAKNTRNLIIENKSSTATMFCTFAELPDEKIMGLDASIEANDNFKCFNITPKEGRMMAKHKYIIRINFSPKRIKSFIQSYCMVFLKIVKVNYRDGVVEEKDIEVKTFSSHIDIDQYSIASMQSATMFPADEIEELDICLRVCLYGEIEEPSVLLIPDTLDIDKLVVGKTYMRTFTLRNKSNSLPITYRYDKVSCIEMEPNELCLTAGGIVEVSVMIKPTRIGQVVNKIGLKLFYQNKQGDEFKVGDSFLCIKYVAFIDTTIKTPKTKPRFNMGITPALTNEVGFLVDDIRFDTEIKKPIQAIVDEKSFNAFNKNSNALISFPNDRPQSLRPSRSRVPCKTMFAGIPRYIEANDEEYALSAVERELKQINRKYYQTYLNMKRKYENTISVSGPALSDYDITGKHHLLNETSTLAICPSLRYTSKFVPKFIPLKPEDLIRVKIKPRYIQLGEIAPYTSCSDCFSINNTNQFPINITITALSNSVVIKGERRIAIKPFKTGNIFFDCYSHGLGKYYVPVYIIINDCHIFDATVFADVVPTTVRCRVQEVRVCPRNHEVFFKIFNPVNCNIAYKWHVQDKCYEVIPKSGIIPFRKGIYCRVKFTPRIDAVFATELYLMSQSGAKQIVKVVHDNVKPNTAFHTDVLDFENISLNTLVTKELAMRNYSGESIMVVIVNPNPMKEISVTPTSGTLKGKCSMFFRVSAHFRAVVDFTCTLTFEFNDTHHQVVSITGRVAYPEIKIEPPFIQIPKIVAGAFRKRVFRVTNKGVTKNSIKFCFKYSPEFTVIEAENGTPRDTIVLDHEESKDLFLEYRPKEPAAYSLYLPCIINDWIGPPVLNNQSTLDPAYFLEPFDGASYTPTVLPKSMPLVSIRCAAGAPWFTFSSMHLEFNSYASELLNQFVIRNISLESHIIRLCLSKVASPFCISMNCCQGLWEKNERYFKINLSKNEEVIFNVEFNPQDHGCFKTEVPIFVDEEKCPFNILTLSGKHPMAEIHFEPEILYMPTIAVMERTAKVISLTFLAHKTKCEVKTMATNENIEVVVQGKKYFTDLCSKLDITVIFKPQHECHVVSDVTVTCSCGISCNVEVRSAACNSRLVSYLSTITMHANKETDFPFFPSEEADEDFLEKMNSLTLCLERWLHSQGFYFRNYFKIPENLARYPFEIYKNTQTGKTLCLPLVQLLVNILNKSIMKCIFNEKFKSSLDEIEGTIIIYNVYKIVIFFLESQGVFVQQIRPEFLMPYHRYLVVKNHFIDKDSTPIRSILKETQFELLSKQCWIDLVLNIYKSFVFDRTMNIVRPKEEQLVYEREFLEYVAANEYNFSNHTDNNENKLLLWLEFHFNKKKSIVWPSQDIKVRKIRCFETDIKDSMVLATLIVAYCPYILDVVQDCYDNSAEEVLLFHNACLMSEVWRKLNLSFTLHLSYAFEPSKVEVIMLLTYLYDVLPYFYPQESIEIKAHLGETASNNITLKNCGNVTIAYTNSLFLNDSEEFCIDSELIVIPPKKEKVLKVSYTAKSFLRVKAVLVLSGETIGYRFAKSRAINLIGIPDIFFVTEEYNFKVNTFVAVKKALAISSPYEQSYLAKIYLHIKHEDTEPDEERNFVPSCTLIAKNVPRQVCIQPDCMFDDNGGCALNLKFCFIACGHHMYHVYFLNKDVGVFCVKISIQASSNKNILDEIIIRVPRHFQTSEPCNCKRGLPNNLCSKFFHFVVPHRNPSLLEGLKAMIKNSLDAEEYAFWVKHLVHPKAFHLLRKYISNTFDECIFPFLDIMDTTVSYKTLADRKRYVIDPIIHMKDVTVEGGCKICIHWESEEFPQQEILKLEAEHGKEMRLYKLVFVKK